MQVTSLCLILLVPIHEEDAMLFSGFEPVGTSEKLLLISVNPLAGADLEGGGNNSERWCLAAKLLLTPPEVTQQEAVSVNLHIIYTRLKVHPLTASISLLIRDADVFMDRTKALSAKQG